MITVFVILGIGIALVVLVGIRNEAVYSQRDILFWEDFDACKRLPTYNHMMLHFWVPVSQFVDRAKGASE